jgi:DNA transformation protein
MGTKGSKLSQDSVLSAELFVEKLSSLGAVTSKKMFGGHGIFHEGKMFGIIDSKGKAFLKADAGNRSDYEEKGAEKHGRMPYFSVPNDILDQPEILIKWAAKSIEISK